MTAMRWVHVRMAPAIRTGRIVVRWAGRRVSPGLRRLGLGHNSLRRNSDRVESAGLVVAWLLLVAAVPLALSIGAAVHRAGLADSAIEMTTRQQVSATLLENVPFGTPPEVGVDRRVPVKARWEWPVGVAHTGEIQAATGATAGAVVPLWVDRSGQAVDAPLTPDQAFWRGIGATVLVLGFALGAVWALFVGFRYWLDRKRWDSWAADWAHVGPQWTQHRK